jgi:hypothetical protein
MIRDLSRPCNISVPSIFFFRFFSPHYESAQVRVEAADELALSLLHNLAKLPACQ